MPPRKRKPQPLHVSLHLIEMERLNVARRTQTRIDVLHGRDQIIYNEAEVELPAKTNGNENYCIIASCLFAFAGSNEPSIFTVAVLYST